MGVINSSPTVSDDCWVPMSLFVVQICFKPWARPIFELYYRWRLILCLHYPAWFGGVAGATLIRKLYEALLKTLCTGCPLGVIQLFAASQVHC